MDLDDVFNFGKYTGLQLEDVIEDDPQYIAWICENELIEFSEEVLELITKKGIV